MAAALLMLDFIHILILIPVGAAAYFTVLLLIRGIGKDEIEVLKEIKSQMIK
ncbi:hypothetical protein HYU15_01380 [Candidatus Woesearchaeota archaeon]|nr:hypothetical protein [Candidatus Woesearchaeota archaeon]